MLLGCKLTPVGPAPDGHCLNMPFDECCCIRLCCGSNGQVATVDLGLFILSEACLTILGNAAVPVLHQSSRVTTLKHLHDLWACIINVWKLALLAKRTCHLPVFGALQARVSPVMQCWIWV